HSTPYHYSILLPRPCPRIHLHIFPTRRSSDLSIKTSPWNENWKWIVQVHDTGSLKAIDFRSNTQIVNQFDNTFYIYSYDARKTADRKSTRLNSSHVSISYAVFCLKTKK